MKGSQAWGAPWGPCFWASPLWHPGCCLRPCQTLTLACHEGLSQVVSESCWHSRMVAVRLPMGP